MYRRVFFITSVMIILSACAEPVLDASDEDSLDRSYEKMLASFSPDSRFKRMRDFTRVRSAYVGHHAFFFEGENRSMRIQRWLDVVDGMNADELYEESERVQQAWILGRLLTARQELRDYQEVVSLLGDVSLIELELIQIEGSPSGYARGLPLGHVQIEATIVNDTSITFYAVQFSADLIDKNGDYSRKYPLYFKIPDGLNPGEQKRVVAFSNIRANNSSVENFSAMALYNSVSLDSEEIIASINFGVLPSIEGVEKVEAEYRSKYGSDEPAEWSANLKRMLRKRNQFKRR